MVYSAPGVRTFGDNIRLLVLLSRLATPGEVSETSPETVLHRNDDSGTRRPVGENALPVNSTFFVA